ncbi:MAG: TrgA family protein [Tabrizicola sp.]|nr:TrgA family protein [Tabrizicola sp.]
MPTAAKLMSAVVFAIVGWIAANYHVPALGEDAEVGLFREMVGFIGLIVGWRVMGPSVGKGYAEATGSGLKTSIVLVFFALLLFSIYEMVKESTKMRYDGPMDAVLDVFNLMLINGREMLTPGVIATLVIGGMIGGWIAENASRRWR